MAICQEKPDSRKGGETEIWNRENEGGKRVLTRGEKRIVAFVITMVMSFTTVFSAGFVSHAEEVIQSQEMTVEAGKAYETQICETDGIELYEFIPEKTGSYQFYSVGDEDTYGYIYDSEKELLVSANDGGEGMNFSIEGNLEAGQTYYLAVDYFLEQVQGTICWHIDYKGEPQISDSIEEAESEVTEQVTEENQGEAEVYEVEPLKEQDYEYVIEEDGTVTITKYTGTDEEVTIPDSINGTTVSSIGEYTFAENEILTKVRIPKNVASLQYEAFYDCTNLKNVEFEEGSKLQTIGQQTFMGCGSLENFTCPDGVETIEKQAFVACTVLENVQFNENLKTIGEHAFSNTGVKSVIIPDNVTLLGAGCFYQCKKLESVIIGKNVKTIDGVTFYECSALKNVKLSNVVTIASDAFIGTALETIEFPDTLKNIGENAFSYSSLTKVDIPSSVESIGESAFAGCRALKEAKIGNGLAFISESAFAGCDLESIIIGNKVESIKRRAFSNNRNLTKITIPKNVTAIEYAAFAGCTNLEVIELPDTLERVDGKAFEGTKWLANQKDGVVYINSIAYAYKNDSTKKADVEIKKGTTKISGYAFYEKENVATVTIPEGVDEIGEAAFYNSGLEKVSLPDSVKTLGEQAFSTSFSLKEVSTGNGITEIPMFAFNSCDIESLTIGDNVQSIGAFAFSWNTNLKEVTIPKNVTSIAYGAFWGCNSLETITLPDALETLGARAFDNTAWYDNFEDGMIYIDKFAYGYKGNMSENTDLEIKPGTKQIVEYAFDGYSNLNSVTIPDSVTEISDFAFYDCSNMKSVVIPGTVTKIGNMALGLQSSNWENGTQWSDDSRGFWNRGYYEPVSDFTIYGEAGSAAEAYAEKYGLNFVKLKHTVTFKDGDKVLSTQEVESGEAAVPPEVPVKEGYVFAGWDGDYTNVKSDIILTAKWAYKDGWSKDSAGNWFYYENGKMVTGWKQIGRDYYYLHEDGHMASDEWIGDYYIDVNGVWQQNIVRAKWMNSNGKWWYRNEDGSYPANAWKMIDGKWYYFDVSGYMVTGWLQLGSTWYYLGTSGNMQTGWTQIGNQEYYFASGGVMAVGWSIIDGNYHYFYSSGVHAENTWVGSYYVKADGAMAVSEWVDNTYYVNADGIYQTGWLKLDGKWYYLNNSGAKQTGWISVSGTWYYGEPETGALLEKEWLNDTYYFYVGGAMATGWVQIDGTYYYCNASGAKVTNTWVGNYYLKADGSMAVSEWVDDGKYYVDANGVWVQKPVHQHQYELTGSDSEYLYYQCKECQTFYQEYNDIEYVIDLGNGETTTVTGHYEIEMAQEIFEQLNEYRVANGLTELADASEVLQEAADIRGYEIVHTFDHIRPNGVRALSSFSASTRCCAENIAAYQKSAEQVMNDWKESSGHNANMLSEYSESVAISVFAEPYLNKYGDIRYRYYFVQFFAR